ncbi:nuclear pore complex subunit [Clarireedia jacksonii]
MSLFGGTQPQQPQQNSNGILGASTAPQNPSGSMFGAASQAPLAQSQQQNGTSGAYFDAILERSRKRAHDEDSLGLQLGLGDIRQRMKKLNPGAADASVDAKAHYLLAASGVDPGAAIRDLSFFNTNAGRIDKTQPQEPVVDADVEGYLARLETQTTMSMISDGLARSVRDFDDFLEENVTMEWSAQRRRIYEHFGIKPKREPTAGNAASFSAAAIESKGGFGRSRRGKGLAPGASRGPGTARASTFGKSSMQRSVIGTAGPAGSGNQSLFVDMEKKTEANGISPGPSDRFLREKQSRYIEKVQEFNEARLRNLNYPIANEFSTVISQAGEQHAVDVVKAYQCLMQIVGEDPDPEKLQLPSAVKQRQFAKAYLDDNQNSPQSIDMKKRILRGTLKFLEKDFFDTVESFVAKNPREALVGGRPTPLTKIKGYIRLRSARKDLVPDNTPLQMIDDDYIWATVYFLLRSGHVSEANDYVLEHSTAFRAIDRNFLHYMADYASSPERKLRRELQDRIHSEYNQRSRIAPENSIDPFRMACYKVIGRCDLGNRSLENLSTTVHDWTWLQFVLAREINRVDEIASEVFGLTEVQHTISEIGAKHFSKVNEVGSPFGVYFLLLVCGGLFENAIDLLYRHTPTDAVHFGIALDFYGLLRVSDPDIAEGGFLTYTTRQKPQVAYGLMVGYHTADFRAANVAAAVDYLTLICLNSDLPGDAGRKQVALCHEALRELILESREFALLLGDIRQDGMRIPGIIEERLSLINLANTDNFMKIVTIQAGSVADDNGRTTDAVLLYHLAEEYDNVVVILNRALSEAIAVPIGSDQMRLQPLKPRTTANGSANETNNSLSLTSVDDPVELARTMIKVYSSNRMYLDRIKEASRTACEALLNISRAKVLVENREWKAALAVIIELDILPLKDEALGNINEIRAYATKFSSLSQYVANSVPNLLMWAITCCNNERNKLMNSPYGVNAGSRRQIMDRYKTQTMDLTTYTGQLRYRFPSHLHEALARAQSE